MKFHSVKVVIILLIVVGSNLFGNNSRNSAKNINVVAIKRLIQYKDVIYSYYITFIETRNKNMKLFVINALKTFGKTFFEKLNLTKSDKRIMRSELALICQSVDSFKSGYTGYIRQVNEIIFKMLKE